MHGTLDVLALLLVPHLLLFRFLNVDPPHEAIYFVAGDVCSTAIVSLPKVSHLKDIRELLERCYLNDKHPDIEGGVTHHAFPLVACRMNTKLVGMITRAQLEQALVAAVEHGRHTLLYVHLLTYADRSPLTVYVR